VREQFDLGLLWMLKMPSNVFIINATKCNCRVQDVTLFWTMKEQLHHHMGKREVDQEEQAAKCLCAAPAALHPSTTFGVHHASSQSTPEGSTLNPKS
jgi:hypothetical protein